MLLALIAGSLTACSTASPIKVVVEKRIAVLPPAEYSVDCPVDYGTGTIEDVIKGLGAAVGCERANNAGLRAWAAKSADEGKPVRRQE